MLEVGLTCPFLSPALSCNENDGDHLDRDQQYTSNQKTKRMRTSFKHHQLRTMKSYFAINHNPDAKDLKQLAQKTGLTKRVLQVRKNRGSSGKFAALGLEQPEDNWGTHGRSWFLGASLCSRQASQMP